MRQLSVEQQKSPLSERSVAAPEFAQKPVLCVQREKVRTIEMVEVHVPCGLMGNVGNSTQMLLGAEYIRLVCLLPGVALLATILVWLGYRVGSRRKQEQKFGSLLPTHTHSQTDKKQVFDKFVQSDSSVQNLVDVYETVLERKSVASPVEREQVVGAAASQKGILVSNMLHPEAVVTPRTLHLHRRHGGAHS